nr:MAG TPA: hypothetical protein [Caudoviricetes sp.]
MNFLYFHISLDYITFISTSDTISLCPTPIRDSR